MWMMWLSQVLVENGGEVDGAWDFAVFCETNSATMTTTMKSCHLQHQRPPWGGYTQTNGSWFELIPSR